MKKQCTKCRKVRPISEFSKSKRNRNGLQSHCKECNKAWWKANVNKKREYGRKYRRENPEKALESTRKYYQENASSIKQQSKRYRQENAAKISVKAKRYWQDHPKRSKANYAVNKAVSSKDIPPIASLNCAHCPSPAQDYHHPSYAKEDRLKVIPLCRSCHKREHAV